MKNHLFIWILALVLPLTGYSQDIQDLDDVKPGRFDQGKMWTFENPPLKYFEEAYGFTPDDEWLEDVRKSALRFSSWCSASFVSENGLIMTNHHCSRSVVASVMKEDENFDENGFYAETQADERRVPDLFVDQLVKIADVTEAVKSKSVEPDSALKIIQKEYSQKEGWSDLALETRTFYSGGKYSLYGYKKYDDIRLVLYPELALGYYGGDPDNFTYPRYNLDFTFYRAYDKNGEPLKPANFFEFNPEGAQENDPIFVIGNPGSTGRYLTMAQLYFQRDVLAPAVLSLIKNRADILLEAAEEEEDIYKKDSITNYAFSLSNSEKAYTGRLKGFNDPYLMTKKKKKEEEVRSSVQVEGEDPWEALEENAETLKQHYPEVLFLSPSDLRGKINMLVHKLYDYQKVLEQGNEEAIAGLKEEITPLIGSMDKDLEQDLFSSILSELKIHSQKGYIDALLGGADPSAKAAEVVEESILLNDPDKFFGLKYKKLKKEPLLDFANQMVPSFRESAGIISQLTRENEALEEKIMNLQFGITGVSSPPDATFSLRIADGVVKGYEYNGTIAPYKTTYFGLYDRHYSHGMEYPWNLPERWKNPSLELLRAPLNFVSTADIIGGNSGSPVINKNAEVVGLVFDGNIESLPGFFIFDDTFNRTVSVHTGGIAAAVKYVYKAERLLSELNID